MPIKTHGLTHIGLAVRDPARSARFYGEVLGARIVYQNDDMVQIQTPEAIDAIVLERSSDGVGETGGIKHFGFRLVDPGDLPAAVEVVERAGGKVREHCEFCPGEPYLFAYDPDGYEIEIWYEPPADA